MAHQFIKTASPTKVWPAGAPIKGVTLGGGDYGTVTTQQVDYFVGKGFNVFRIPFAMENMCPTPGGALNSYFTAIYDPIISYITTTKNCWCILDPHNYMQFSVGASLNGNNGNVTGGTKVYIGQNASYTVANFTSFWGLVAGRWNNSKVIFELNNEPFGCDENTLIATLNTTISSLRTAGYNNLILVPSNNYDQGWGGWDQGLNGNMLLQITDSANNIAFVVHQYLDTNYSGTSATCVVGVGGRPTLGTVTKWARRFGKRLFLGEFAGGNNTGCQTEVTNALQYIDDNKGVWMGWCWWYSVAGQTSYIYQLLPDNLSSPVDKAQMAWLTPFIGT